MSFSDFYSDEIRDSATQNAIQSLFAQLRAFTNVSFNEDGSLIPAPPGVGLSPIGSIIAFGGSTAPAKWLLCDGTAVSRVTYKDLFAVIGTTYGTGDGSTTFTLPDLRQRFPMGKAATGTGATLGSSGGAVDHTHSGGSLSGSTGATAPSISGSTGATAPGTDSQGSHDHGGATGSHTHDTTHATGINNASATVQSGSGATVAASPHLHLADGTTSSATASISSDGSHAHTVDSHTHGAGTLAVASHTHGAGTLAIGTMGTANAPYQVVMYLIHAGV